MKISVNIRRSGTTGFTLLELVMVMAIMGAILGICVVQWPHYTSSWDIEIEAKKIAANIRLAQQRSILEERPFRIVFDQPMFPGIGYRVERFEASDLWSKQSSVEYPDAVDVHFDPGLPYQDSGTSSPNKTDPAGLVLTFDQFGGVLLSAPANRKETVLSVSSPGGKTAKLYISNYTGIVSLHD